MAADSKETGHESNIDQVVTNPTVVNPIGNNIELGKEIEIKLPSPPKRINFELKTMGKSTKSFDSIEISSDSEGNRITADIGTDYGNEKPIINVYVVDQFFSLYNHVNQHRM